jgi:hypothetical protein
LQIFDTGMALAMNKGALAILPAALGAIDVWAGLFLLRVARPLAARLRETKTFSSRPNEPQFQEFSRASRLASVALQAIA